MLACPNINTKEWKELEKTIGQREAFREYMKLGTGEIPVVNAPVEFREKPFQESLLGLDIDDPNTLEFQAITINAVSNFLTSIGVEQRLVPEFLSKDGSVIEGALAAANFIDNTVDIIEDAEKRPAAWNKLPEEAAHWWYRLLKQDSSLKGMLWDSHKTALKASKLYKTKYAELEGVNKPEDLTEEAIGQLIAESIKRMEEKKGTKEDYSFIDKMLKWINKLLLKFAILKQDPFEVAAMKILASDMSDLLTVDEYTALTSMSKTQIHEGEIYDGDYLNELLEENLKDKDKYVYKVKVADLGKTPKGESPSIDELLGLNQPTIAEDLIKSIKTFRKKNPTLNIYTDKGYGSNDIIYKRLANGKEGAFVKATGNFAFKDYYYYLDYANKITLGRQTYYFLTDNFSKGTQREFYEKAQNEMARKKAAKEGRYTISPTKNPYLSPRLKKTFFKYLESLKEKMAELPEMLKAIQRQKLLLDKYDKRIEEEFKKEHAKSIERFKNIDEDPLVRQSAIDNLLKNLNSKYITEYKDFFEKLPTIVLVNMNLQAYITGYSSSMEAVDMQSYGSRPFRYDPFLQEFSSSIGDAPLIPNTSSVIPTEFEQRWRGGSSVRNSFKYAIEAVNKKIVANTLDTQLTEKEKENLYSIGYRSFVNNVKTKSMAVALEIIKQDGNRNATIFYRQLQKNKEAIKEKLKQKFLTKFPEEAKLINEYREALIPEMNAYLENQDKIFNIINSKLTSSFKFNTGFAKENVTNVEDVPTSQQYDTRDGIMSYTYFGNDKGWYLEYDYSGTFDGMTIFDKTRKLTDEEVVDIFNESADSRKDQNIKLALLKTGEFIYDSARYSPDLTAFNAIINSVRNEIVDSNMDPQMQYYMSDTEIFARVYSALILKSGYIYDILKNQSSSNQIQERVNDIVDWITGGTAADVLEQKLDSIYEFIKGKNTIVTSNELTLSYSPELGLYKQYENNKTVDDLIKAQASIYTIQGAVEKSLDSSEIGLLKLESKNLPEGFYIGGAKKLDFPNLTSFPQEFQFTHRIDYVNMPEISLNMLPKDFREYLETGLLTVNLKDYKKQKTKVRPEEPVDDVFISKTKSNLLSQKEAKYSFDHNATLYYDENSFPYYKLNAPGKKFRVEFSAPENSPFPEELYAAFKLNHGGKRMKADNAIGWFSGTFTRDALYVTEVQSDLLQRTFELSNKWLDEKGFGDTHKFRKFTGFKSKLENYYNGWMYVFTGTGLQVTLKNNPDIKEIYIPTSDYYKKNVSAASPYQYYDKMASIFPSATKTDDGKFYKIDRKDIFTGISKDTKGYYDVIIKSALSAGIKEQKDLTPDIGSDREIAIDILTTLFDIDILSEYLLSPQGEQHLAEIEEYINEKYSDEKPMTDDTSGGELVDSEGNVIPEEEESEESKQISDLIKQSEEINQRRASLDVDNLLDQLSEAIQEKDVNRQNFIKKLLEQANTEGGKLFGLEVQNKTTKETPLPLVEQQKKEIGQNIVMAVAGRMMNNLGVKFNIVTPEQARKITEGAKNPWNGQKAFFYNGQTYFLSEGFTTENVLHEYSHPLVDAIFATNKELFNKLYDMLSSSEEGMKIIDEVTAIGEYGTSKDPMFRKEVLVRALAAEAQNKINDVAPTKEFKNFIERAIFAIKQALRKVFGTKVKVEKLSTDTTLKQLADMLVSEEFDLDTEIITDKDYVEYLKERDELFDSLSNVENSELSLTIDRFYQLTSRQIFQVMKNKNYAEAKTILVNEETKKGLLQEIKATLESTAEIDEKLKDLLDEQQIREKNVKNFVHSINRLDILTSAVLNHMRELVKKEDNQEILNSVFYYDLLVRNWSKFIEETNQRLFDAGMDEKSELGKMLSSIQTSLETTKRLIREAYTPGVFEVLRDTIKPLAEDIDRQFKEQLEKARKVNAPQKAIDEIQKKWDATKITDERIMDLLLGEAGDTNPVSAYLEAYTNSPDLIVGGFAVFLKNAYTDVDLEAQRNSNDFMRDMAPLLEAAGYSRSNFTKLMEKLAFLDEMTYFNSETGKLEKKKVWTFLNEFMNVDSQVKQFNYDYEQALEKGDQAEADKILKDKRKHLREYFNQEYTDEYYAREDVYDSLDKNKDLEDAVYKVLGVDKTKATTAQKAEADALYDRSAKEAYRRKQLIISEVKELDGRNYEPEDYDEIANLKSLLWRQYSRIASLRDVNGQLKFGEELLIALIEKKYRKVSNDVFEWKPITGQFDFALQMYEQSLLDSKIAKDSEEFKEKRKKWIKDNTVIKYTDEFYKERNEKLSKLKKLLAEIKKRNPSLVDRIDSTDEIEQMLDLSLGFRDQNGQIIGDDISDPSKDKFRELQEAIIEKKESYAGFSGLTAAEDRELSQIFDRLKNKTATAEDKVRLNELMEVKNELGIDKATQLQLQKLYRDLAEIQSKEATDYYVEQLNDWLTHMGENPVDNDTASSILAPETYTKLFKADPKFEKWFKENHVRKEVYDRSKGEDVVVYERLFIWNRTRPNNPEHFQSFKLASGEEIPGVPILSYNYRTVREKYKTKKVVGKNVDNRGRFLPKTLQQGAPFDSPYLNKQYEELRSSDPAAFKVLEKMKQYHLKWQETTPFESRLYMQVPRYRSMASENFRDVKEKTISKSRRAYKNIRDVFVTSKDDYQDGLSYDKAGQLVDADMFNEETHKIPITGLYDLKPEEVSMNFLDSMLRYMHSGLKQRKLVELNPFAQALTSVVEDPNNAIQISGKFIKSIYKKTGRKVPIREKGQSVRSKAISNLYDREFKGIRINDFTRNMPAAWKLKAAAGKLTSLGAFALNIPSALKNRQGAVVQGLIEAAGGRWMSAGSYILGKGRAFKMMAALSSQVYVTTNKSLDVQLMQIFDPSQDFTKRSIETQFGRSLVDDAASLSILMNPRKFLQLEATLEVMCGMLYHIKVPQTINGQTRDLEYINAFEIRNGQIELKPGIDPEWAPGGAKFKETKNKIHEVGNRLEGTYGEFDAAEIDRTYFGSAIKFMKKFFTSMFMNWFAVERNSVALGTVSSGNYIGFINMMKNIIKYGTKSFMWASESDMAGFRKTLMQIANISFHYLVLSFIFGYDPDDEERFAKMRNREKESWGGWVVNHGALLTLGTLTESETWTNPFIFYYTAEELANPKQLYEMYLKKPFDFVDHSLGLITGDKGAFYKQDSGPYWFQKEGAPKAINDVAKIFGFTGGAVSPAKGMKSTEDARKGLFR